MRRLRRGSAVAAISATLLALCAPTSGHATARTRGCAPTRFTAAGAKLPAASVRTVARDGSLAVLQLRLRGGGEDTIVCVPRSGRLFRFVSTTRAGSEGTPSVYPGEAAVAGPRAAAIVVGANEAGPYEQIVVLSVRAGRAIRAFDSINTQVIDPDAPGGPLGVAAVVLRPDGAVAAGICAATEIGGPCTGAPSWQAIIAVPAGASAVTALAEGTDVDAASLALRGTELTWTQGGQTQTSSLP